MDNLYVINNNWCVITHNLFHVNHLCVITPALRREIGRQERYICHENSAGKRKIFAQKYWPEVIYIKGRRCQRWHYKYNIKPQPSVATRGQPKSNHIYIEEAKALSDESITTFAKKLDISKESFFFLFQSLFWDLMLCGKYRGNWHTGWRQKMHCWYVAGTLCPIQEREEKCLDTQ